MKLTLKEILDLIGLDKKDINQYCIDFFCLTLSANEPKKRLMMAIIKPDIAIALPQ